ncbi:MAG: hypothetical protein RMK99_07860 [Anaerolineales bacterium]|nr:hypothetical protein [Anaerolineales bacterium]
MRARLSLFLLSAATLVFEINLTRLFAVAQFYHFAFMIVSLALLGFGASGTLLALVPAWAQRQQPGPTLSRLGPACGLCMLGSYLLINGLPFDSFSITWDARQVAILVVHYLALASPFFFSGLAVGILLTASPQDAGRTYGVNLLGSAAGCALALAAPAWLGGEGVVTLSAALAASAGLMGYAGLKGLVGPVRSVPALGLLLFCLYDLGARLAGWPTAPAMELRLSPYKGLSYALQYPDAAIIFQEWNAFSRVDVVQSRGVRSLPGLSYRYLQPPPPQHGLLVDADELSPIVLPGADPAFAGYLPAAIAFQLRPEAEALILEPRGGLDVTTALLLGAGRVTAVEANPLIVQAARHVYADPRVRTVIESDRSYLRRATEQYDVVMLSLASSYHPIRSGAYSLAEDYRYTVEAFRDALLHLKPEGLFVVTRWLQSPPSEELRAFALAVTALEQNGLDPTTRLVAFRGYNTATLLVKTRPFSAAELEAIRDFAAGRAFDLIYAPGLRAEESNRYNIQPEPIYFQTFTALLAAKPREAWYAAYPFEVAPPTDDRPFFGHFFKWSQAGQVLAELGRTWQPFGGAGYFVLLALLLLALVLAAGLMLLPAVRLRRGPSSGGASPIPALIYFGLIGLAFLLVEIPLIQQFILYLGQPAYAVTAVLFTLLFFSGIGSRLSARLPHRPALGVLVALAFGLPFLLPRIFELTLGLSFPLRLGLSVALLAPLGVCMGLPFPKGIAWMLAREGEGRPPNGASAAVPWAWAANGAASVVSSVVAALLALSFGFSFVLFAGASCYAGAWLTVVACPARSPSPRP